MNDLRNEFRDLKNQINENIAKSQQEISLKEQIASDRCQIEIQQVQFEKMVHLQLIDCLYESQGSVIFNEIHNSPENPEFRFFNEEIVESNVSPEVLIVGG